MTTKQVDSYRLCQPLYLDDVDDPDLMEIMRASTSRQWRERVKAEGGEPVEDPQLTVEPNPHYGFALQGEAGEPLLTEDGERLVDPVKAFLFVTGRTVRP